MNLENSTPDFNETKLGKALTKNLNLDKLKPTYWDFNVVPSFE